MGHWYYITPEEYAQAAKYGIRPEMLDRRVREQGWTKERAMTTPPRIGKSRTKWREVAEQNGISRHLFYTRILHHGWSEKRAATQPIASDEDRARNARIGMEAARVHPAEYIELARSNGIPYKRFAWRVRNGWSYEQAATETKVPPQEAGRRAKQKNCELYGDILAPIFQKKG